MTKPNQSQNTSLTEVLLAVKHSTMLDTHVAEVCKVESIDDNDITCRILSLDMSISCRKLDGVEVKENDCVLVIFTDRAFKTNLYRKSQNIQTSIVDDSVLHSFNFGIIIGVIS